MTKRKQPEALHSASVRASSKKTTSLFRVQSRLQAQDIINIPLAIFVIFCLYTVVTYAEALSFLVTQPSSIFFMQPTSVSLLVAIFGIIFLYSAVRRRSINIISNIAAGVLALIFILALVFVSSFGSQDLYFKLGVALFNAFVGPILSLIAIVGTVSMVIMKIAKK